MKRYELSWNILGLIPLLTIFINQGMTIPLNPSIYFYLGILFSMFVSACILTIIKLSFVIEVQEDE